MDGFDLLRVKSAVKARNRMNLSRSHLTTMDFGQPVPLFNEETIPGDKFSIDGNYFSRMAPLVKPTYGKFSFRTMSVFVPYHQVADDAEAFFANKRVWEGHAVVFRHFTMYSLINFVISYCTTNTGASATNYDITYVGSSGTQSFRLFTNVGRYWVKVLNSLGYAIPENADLQSGSTWMADVGPYKLSAYPLLAFFKAFNDYMSQSQRFNTSQLTQLLNDIKHNVQNGSDYSPNGVISYTGLNSLFYGLKLTYANDYFTSAWAAPNAPLDQPVQDFNQTTGTAGSNPDLISHQNDDNYLSNSDNSDIAKLGQRALDLLKSWDDYVRRNNYSGSREVQGLYSRFGIKTSDYRANYAHVLSTSVMPISVGDVTAQASSSQETLGDYAGKGILSGNNSLKYEANDYGLLCIIGWYTIKPMMAYGFDRKVLRNTPLDFYTPEFDGIGADAIPYMEVYENPTAKQGDDISSDVDVYGFTERYNSYRFGRDQITGEFRYFGNNADAIGMNVWHTGRLLTSLRNTQSMIAQAPAMVCLPTADSEFNRIFSVTSGSFDHFYMTCEFAVSAVRPMNNLNQVVRLGEGSVSVPRNGNEIN